MRREDIKVIKKKEILKVSSEGIEGSCLAWYKDEAKVCTNPPVELIFSHLSICPPTKPSKAMFLYSPFHHPTLDFRKI